MHLETPAAPPYAYVTGLNLFDDEFRCHDGFEIGNGLILAVFLTDPPDITFADCAIFYRWDQSFLQDSQELILLYHGQ